MTAETEGLAEVSEVSKVEIDKCALDMSSYQDLPQVGADCNGLKHVDDDGEGINGKDDPDGSYVFVSRTNSANDDPVGRDFNAEFVHDSNVVSESNVDTGKKDPDVQVGELNVQNSENAQLCVEDVCIVEGTDVAPSNNDVVPEGSLVKPDVGGEEAERTYAEEKQIGTEALDSEPQQLDDDEAKGKEQIELASPRDLKENHESLSLVLESGNCESPQQDGGRGKVKSEEQCNLESTADSGEVPESQIMVLEAGDYNGGEVRSREKKILEDIGGCEDSQIFVSQAVEFKQSLLDDVKVNPEEQDNLESTAELEKSQEPQIMVRGAAECKLSEDEVEKVKSEEETKSISAKEAEECLESHVTITNPESYQLDNGEEKLGEENKADFDTDVKENQESEIVITNNADSGLDQEKKAAKLAENLNRDQNEESSPTSRVEDVVTEVINESIKGSQKTSQLNVSSVNAESLPSSTNCVRSEIKVETAPVGGGENLLSGPYDVTVVREEVECGASLTTESFPTCAAGDTKTETEVESFNVKSRETNPSYDDGKSEMELENGPDEGDGTSSSANDVSSETDIGLRSADPEKKLATFPCKDVNIDSEVSNEVTEYACSQPISVNALHPEFHDSLQKSESEIEDSSSLSNGESPGNDAAVSRSKILDDSAVNGESGLNCVPEVLDVENVGDKLNGGDGDGDDKLTCQETEGIEGTGRDGISASAPEGFGAESGLNCVPEVVDVENVGDKLNGGDGDGDDKLTCQETEGIEGTGRDGISASAPEGFGAESGLNCVPEVVDVENVGDKLNGGDGYGDDKLTCQETEGIEGTDRDGISASAPEGSGAESGLNCVPQVVDVENVGDKLNGGDGDGDGDDKLTCQETEGIEGTDRDGISASAPEGSGAESGLNCVPQVVDVENVGDKLNGGDGDGDDKLTCQETEGIEGTDRDGISASALEGSGADALDGQNTGADTGKRPFHFLIKIPRYDDEKLREQIRHAQLQVDKKTQHRDAIRVEIQMKRAISKEYHNNYEAAKSEERAARGLVKSKRQEIDSVQSVINRAKNAISVEDIDGKIHNMEHMIQHETMPLKEEKQFIREIKQLKHFREQLSSNMGSQDEVKQALDQRDQIEERSKILKKELDCLRDKASKAKAIAESAEKKSKDENEKLKELQAQFRAADDIRQEAYAHLQSLRRQLYEKNKHFRMYKDDATVAINYALSQNKEALHCLCVNQVETIMELWNKNDEFRRDYVRGNIRSTLRRLRTLDGRSLGPDEQPPVLSNVMDGRRVDRSFSSPVKVNSVYLTPSLEEEKQGSTVDSEKVDIKSMAKVAEQKNLMAKTKKPAKPVLGNGSVTVSGMGEAEEAKEEEHKQTKEELELDRRAEELRKEEAAARLKEQRRLEEKAKAKEALERKKRNAEKAHIRAELRAQKEAEQKEKEREKRARKKEKKKGPAVEAPDGKDEGETDPTSETPTETMKEPEIKVVPPITATKKPKKPSQFTKQSKTTSIPPPLRNRGKRRMQQWMWVILPSLLVLALFLLGHSNFSPNLWL
ncbi:hypothetical protein F0562_017931 [Nyssa sinensis]|uniref:Uncharacterized protein n=1 Tax=Nyssa sinensis TaxID=561372 RepID=A0A5J4ZAM0_9ASTE|nr:hypothetical protein F0562_017931 [Nyssa sinensis]